VACVMQNAGYYSWRRQSSSVACVGPHKRFAQRGRPQTAMVCPTGLLGYSPSIRTQTTGRSRSRGSSEWREVRLILPTV
jgi:hypothetical protein